MKIGQKIILSFLIIIVLVVVFLGFIMNKQKNILKEYVDTEASHLSEVFSEIQKEETKALSVGLEILVQNEDMKTIYLEKDREKLYDYTKPLFSKLKEKYDITHFYFILPDGRCFLRIHNKDINGDMITRYTFEKAQQQKTLSSGIELGKTAFALRAVKPYYKDNMLIGYLELGQEIDAFLNILKGGTKNQFVLFVDKDRLNRDKYKSVKNVRGEENDWDKYQDHVVLSSTLKEKNANLLNQIQKQELSKAKVEEKTKVLKGLLIDTNNKYAVCGLNLIDVNDKHAGDLITFIDITNYIKIMKDIQFYAIIMIIVLCIVVAIIGLLINNTIVPSLSRLEKASHQISSGDLDVQLNARAKDEIGSLTLSFKQMADNLKETTFSRDYVEKIIGSMLDCLIVVDPDVKIRTVNKATCDLLKYEEKELIGENISLIVSEKKEEESTFKNTKLQELVKEGSVENYELNFKTKEGNKIHVLLSSTVMRDKNGEMTDIVCMAKDITKHKKAEAAVMESEKKFRGFVENATDVIYSLDLNGEFCYVSPNWTEFLGHDLSEVVGKPFGSFVHPDDLEKCQAFFQKVVTAGEKQSGIEFRVKHKDGSWRWHTSSASAQKNNNGKTMHFMGISRDITEHKQFEEQIMMFKTFAETSSQGMGWADVNGNIIYVNSALAELFGEKDTTLPLGKNVATTYYPEDEQLRLNNEVFPVVLEEGEWSGELMLHKTNGELIPTHNSLFLIRNEASEPMFFANILTDITERKKAEEELKMARAQAEHANQSKSQFLANMSHEIRTPMNGIIGASNLLLNTHVTAEQQRFLEIIDKSANGLLSIIDSILDYSRIEAGKIELESIDFDLRLMVESVIDMFSFKSNEKGIVFDCCIHNDVPSLLRGDPGRLRQVLINLAGNALKFTHKGEVSIDVSCDKVLDNHATIQFRVSDTGIGIPQESISRLFQSFSQIDSSTVRQYGGTGLGLAISKGFVEKMGGKMGVESEQSKGSTFWFTAVFEKQLEQTRLLTGQESCVIEKQRILVVDDHYLNCLVLTEELKALGYRHDQAQNGTVALEKLHNAREQGDGFTVVIIDKNMPQMDGMELGRCIKSDSDFVNITLVMLVSMGEHGDVERAEECGFSSYLTKPVKHTELGECLSILLGKRKHDPDGKPDKVITRHVIKEEQKRRLKILLVEDNEFNQEIIKAIIRKAGYRVSGVISGKDALAALVRIDYDIVFMDIQMPGMSGYETTKHIRNPESSVCNHEVFIVALTANAMKGDRDKCLNAGMNEYLSKPIKSQELLTILEQQISGKQTKQLDSQDANVKLESFDKNALLDSLGGDMSSFNKIIQRALESFPKDFDALEKAMKMSDIAHIRKSVHSIKGASANLRANKLSDIAKKMETICMSSDDIPRAEEYFSQLKDEHSKIKSILMECLEASSL